jgi:hypothetical protein
MTHEQETKLKKIGGFHPPKQKKSALAIKSFPS